MSNNEERSFPVLRVIAAVLANLTAILSANYIVFYILDHFNPGFRFVVRSDFFLTKYLHLIIPLLLLLTGLFYLLILAGGGFRKTRLKKPVLIAILIIDVVLAGAFAMTVNARAFGWGPFKYEQTEQQTYALPTLEPTRQPAETPTPVPETPVPETPEPTEAPTPAPGETPAPETPTPEPTEEPTPEPTPIAGLLGDKYKEKFAEGEPVISEPNTSETLEDGTVRTLIYTYAGRNAAIELYHYKKGKLEYQIAELYLRDIHNLVSVYEPDQGKAKRLVEFARDNHALIAINSDYFSNNAKDQGLIIRNGIMVKNNACRHSDLCVVYQDGTVRCFDCRKDNIDNNSIAQNYPYHSFYFGPALLDADGNAKTSFNSTLGTENPRTAFGYYEPGHYAFISILGDRGVKDINGKSLGNGKSPGLSLADLSSLCAALGMKAAYNFDGGGSSGMYWNEKVFGHNSRVTGDALIIVD